MKKILIICVLSLLIFSAFSNQALSRVIIPPPEPPPCPSPPTCPGGTISQTWYQCKPGPNGCDGTIQRTTTSCNFSCWAVAIGAGGDGCPAYTCQCDTCTPPTPMPNDPGWSNIEEGHPWQKCRPLGVRTSRPSFSCAGQCLETPKNPRYYNNPTFPTNPHRPERSLPNTNLLLPVKLDWDNIKGWGEPTGPQSYRINIDNTRPINPLNRAINKSEFIPDSCALRSNTTHNWQVQACCSPDGTNCGPSSSWNFTTNIAPELISPADPDWIGTRGAENVSIPVIFDWCDVEGAQSYFLKLYQYKHENGERYFSPIFYEPLSKESKLELGPEFITKFTDYRWRIATCLNPRGKRCAIRCRADQSGTRCGDFSQFWKMTTGDFNIPPPEILAPLVINNIIPAVNIYDYLRFRPVGIRGALSYRYEIKKDGRIIFSSFVPAGTSSIPLRNLGCLRLNQTYTWTIRSCWDVRGRRCEEKRNQSKFITTGAPPTNLTESPKDKHGNKIIPVLLDWNDMPGSVSYKYEVFSGGERIANGIVFDSNILLSYDKLKMNRNYNWRVKTCADRKALICGEWSNQNFITFTLAVPINPDPEIGGNFYTHERHLRWEKVLGAKFYQYRITGPKNISPTIIPTNSIFLNIPRFELGKYNWQVQACLDRNCHYAGNWSAQWSFALVEGICQPGLIPCARNCNIPETPWNERSPCEFKHIFILIYIIINFVLWTAIPLILVILVVITGLIFYFSLLNETADAISKIKALWRSVGIGLGIIFLAWTIISWVLTLLNYQVGIFGPWWQI